MEIAGVQSKDKAAGQRRTFPDVQHTVDYDSLEGRGGEWQESTEAPAESCTISSFLPCKKTQKSGSLLFASMSVMGPFFSILHACGDMHFHWAACSTSISYFLCAKIHITIDTRDWQGLASPSQRLLFNAPFDEWWIRGRG